MVKIEERGRGKFKPIPNYNIDDVKKILLEKIEEEVQNQSTMTDYDINKLVYEKDKVNVIGLFSGSGGLDLGIELAGLDVVLGKDKTDSILSNYEEFNKNREQSIFHHLYANDIFKEALETYSENFPKSVLVHLQDIRKIKDFPSADIVLGGPPCPGFSEAGPRLVDDPRNFLYIHYIRCLIQVQPKFFIMENVKGMLTLGKGEVFRQIKQDFEAAGYRVYHKLVNARDYGAPQIRERVFLVGVRNDIDFEYKFPESTHGLGLKPFVTLKESIGDLESNPGEYFTGSYSTIFLSRNRKKNWDEQSFTIQASGRQAPIHPGGLPMQKVETNKWIFTDGEENNRRLSVKEIARIQNFPDWFTFSDGKNKEISLNGRLDKIYKQIGNAVPVTLARAIATPIAEWLYSNIIRREQMTNRPTTNILIALANILKNKQITMPTVYTPSNKNRITSVGDLLEYYVKDSFCNKAFEAKKTEEKLEAYRTAFSYLGNSNNPPDFIIRHGPAVEVKKIGNESNGNIALNSSFPKDYLYSTDKRISSACVKCENDFNGWTKKDMIYAIGNVKNDHLNSLWLIYGDCYAADKKIYERISDTIKDGVTEIENVDFGDTKELGRVNRVDPLGITYLRIRGMWGISHPSELYNSYIKKENNKTNIYVMMKKETYENMYDKPDFNEFLSNNILTKELLMVPDPNNPIAKIEVILFMAAF